jgi:tRNA 2-thiouridine synthesizing protein A
MTKRNAETPLVVDARGMRCPWPVLRAARAMRESGHVLLIADDPLALNDVPEMAEAQGWQCSVVHDESSTRFTINRI